MTEERGQYNVTAESGAIRSTCFLPFDEGWTEPTPAEVRELIKRLDMTGSQVAAFVGAKSSRNVRKWQAENTKLAQSSSGISYSAWRLLAERLARIRTDQPSTLDITGAGKH